MTLIAGAAGPHFAHTSVCRCVSKELQMLYVKRSTLPLDVAYTVCTWVRGKLRAKGCLLGTQELSLKVRAFVKDPTAI